MAGNRNCSVANFSVESLLVLIHRASCEAAIGFLLDFRTESVDPPQLAETGASLPHCGQLRGPPLPGGLAGGALQEDRPPRGGGPGGVLAAGQSLVPLVGEVGVDRGGPGGDQVAPVLRHLLALVAGQVDGHRLLTVELEGASTELPHVGDDLTGLAGGHVHQVALGVLGPIRVGGGGEVVPGLGRRDTGIGEQVVAVEQTHRARVLRDAPEAVVGVDLAPHPLGELGGDVGRGVRRQVEQRAVTQRERRDELELHLGDVRPALSGLDRRAELLVVRSALADVDDVDLDLRVRLREEVDLVLDVGHPGPEGQGGLGVQGLVDVGLRDRGGRGLWGAARAGVTAAASGQKPGTRGRSGRTDEELASIELRRHRCPS